MDSIDRLQLFTFMNWIILLLSLAIAGFLYWKGMTMAALAVAGVGILVSILFPDLFSGKKEDQSPDAETTTIGGNTYVSDSCGCEPGQVVNVYKKNLLGKYKKHGFMPCASYLALIGRRPKKYVSRGCVN